MGKKVEGKKVVEGQKMEKKIVEEGQKMEKQNCGRVKNGEKYVEKGGKNRRK